MHVCFRLNITFFKELVTRYVHVSLSRYMYFWLAVYSTYNNSSFHLSWSLLPIEDKFLDKKRFQLTRESSNTVFPRVSAHAPIGALPRISSEPLGQNIKPRCPSPKKRTPPPPPFLFHFLTSVNSSDTRKTCFYCHSIFNFWSFNFNIHTDTSEFKVENGTTGRLITNGC